MRKQIVFVAALALLSDARAADFGSATRLRQPVSSYQLISRALAAGQINEETATKYRVFAAFGHPGLPAQFQGDDSGIHEPPPVVARAGALLNTFSAQTRADLAPFFRPPGEPGSWVELADSAEFFDAGHADAIDAQPSDESVETSRTQTKRALNWHTVLAAGGKVKIWALLHHQGDSAKAEAIAREMTSTIWPRLVPTLGPPKSDMADSLNSGGPELDIFLVRPSPARAVQLARRSGAWLGLAMSADQISCDDAAYYLLVDSRHPLGSATSKGLLQTVAHEFTHALTGAKHLSGSCEEYDWMREATATWAEHKAYPLAQSEQGNAFEFLEDVSISLPTNTVGGDYNAHGYHSYLFPFYLHLTNKEAAIGAIWNNFQSYTQRFGIDAGLRAHGLKFEEVFPKFAVENLNLEDTDLYKKNDKLSAVPDIADSHDVTIPPGTVVYEKPIDLSIDYLATHYTKFLFDQSVQMITFENTLVPMGYAGVWVKEKRGVGWEHPIDLTKVHTKTWCRDNPLQDIDGLVFSFTNNEWRNITRRVQPSAGYQPMLRAYPEPCGRGWTGTHRVVNTMTSTDPALTIVETIDGTIRFALDSTLIVPGQPAEYWKSVGGSLSWRVQVTGSCTGSGSGGTPIPNLRDDHVASLRVWTEGGKRHHSGTNGPWPGDIPRYTITCPNGSSEMVLMGALGFFVTDFAKDDVAPDGKSFSGRHTSSISPAHTTTHQYSFRCSFRC